MYLGTNLVGGVLIVRKFSIGAVMVGLVILLANPTVAQEARSSQAQTLGIGGNVDARVRVAIGKLASARGYQVLPPWENYREARYQIHVHSFEVKSDRWKVGASLPMDWARNTRWYSYYQSIPQGQAEQVRSVCRVQVEGFGPAGWYLSSGYSRPGSDLRDERYGVGTGTATGGYERQHDVETQAIELAVREVFTGLPAPVAFPPPSPPPAAPVVEYQPNIARPASSSVAQAGPTINVVVNPNGRKGLTVYGPARTVFYWTRWDLRRTQKRSGTVPIPMEGFVKVCVQKSCLLDIGLVDRGGRLKPVEQEHCGILVHPGTAADF